MNRLTRILFALLLCFSLSLALAGDGHDRRPPADCVKIVSGAHGGAVDRSFLAQTSTIVGAPTFSARAMTFDGVDDHMHFPDHSSLSRTDGSGTDGPLSLACWIYPTSVSTAYRAIATKGQPSNYEYALYSQLNRTGNNGPCLFIYNASAGAWIARHANANALTVNTWQHLAATYSGSEASSGIKVYLNGVQIDDTSWNFGTYTGMSNGSSVLRLAALDSPARDFYPGSISGFLLFTRELSATEIKTLYAEGRP